MLIFPGSDGKNDQKRMFMAFLYMRDPKNPENADSNHYAFPLPILPVLDASTMKVIRIDHLPTGKGPEEKPTQKASIHPPREYTPEHQSLRDDLKPLQVTQPKGASFKATKIGEFGEIIDWQKWSIKVGFNQREGMVLYDVSPRRSFPVSRNSPMSRFAMTTGACSIDCRCRI